MFGIPETEVLEMHKVVWGMGRMRWWESVLISERHQQIEVVETSETTSNDGLNWFSCHYDKILDKKNFKSVKIYWACGFLGFWPSW